MEAVNFDFYSYKPRMSVNFTLKLHTVPVVGDFIHVDPKYIKQVSKKLVNRDSVTDLGMDFVVTKRTKYMTSIYKEDWRIELSPVEPLQDA
jgi:hypothetical protein